MYSPVFLSNPTTSGSPPVLSISLSDQSFSALASSFACTLAHSRPLWRFIFFFKKGFHALSSFLPCFCEKSFFFVFIFFALFFLIIVAFPLFFFFFPCCPPPGFFLLFLF